MSESNRRLVEQPRHLFRLRRQGADMDDLLVNIENFKGIKSADFDFDRSVNIIIGNNGAGKTSVLEAIAVALGGFLSGIDGVNTIHFSKDEIRRENQLTGRGSNNIVYKTPGKHFLVRRLFQAVYIPHRPGIVLL
mgnify:CR=1 FL=1